MNLELVTLGKLFTVCGNHPSFLPHGQHFVPAEVALDEDFDVRVFVHNLPKALELALRRLRLS